MGMSYTVTPVREYLEWKGSRRILRELGWRSTRPPKDGRYPTYNELKETLLSIPEIELTNESYRRSGWQLCADRRDDPNFDIILESRPEVRNCRKRSETPFYVYRAREPVIVLVVERLARFCGPFVVDDEDVSSILIKRGTAPETMWVDWSKVRLRR